MRILVLGATSFIGSCFVKRLSAFYNHELVGTGYFSEQNVNIPLIHWTDAGKIDCLVNFSARNDTQSFDNDAMMYSNCDWPIDVFEYYYKRGCRKFLYSSSGAAIDCLTPYAKSKHKFDQWAMTWMGGKDISCIGFRYSNVWSVGTNHESHKGSRASMIYQIYNNVKDGISPVLFKGNPTRDFINVEDVVTCLIRALDVNVNGVFNLGSGTSVSFENVLDYCNKLLGTSVKPNYIECPFGNTYQYYTKMDISKTKETFNWKPTIFIE